MFPDFTGYHVSAISNAFCQGLDAPAVGLGLGMSDIGFFANIQYAILSNSKFSMPIPMSIFGLFIFPQT